MKKVGLELGGKSPLIIFDDCDMERAVRYVRVTSLLSRLHLYFSICGYIRNSPLQGLSGVFFNKGENCIAAGRLYIEETIHDEYVARVVSSRCECNVTQL